APALERGDARLEGLDALAEVGNDDDAGLRPGDLPRDVQVGAAHGQDELRTGAHGRADLGRVERVDAHPRARGHELVHDVAELGELAPGRAADVDHVGPTRAVVLGLSPQGVAREPGGVVHFGDDLDVVGPVGP